MTGFLISLDEVDAVRKKHDLPSTVQLADRTNIARNTWAKALKTRRPTPVVLDALAQLGARADRILVADDSAYINA